MTGAQANDSAAEIPARCVVDASVGIKLFLDEPLAEQAHALFAGLTGDLPAHLYVPDLFYIECANILWKYTRRFGRSLEDSLADLSDLSRLTLRSVPTSDLMEEALSLAFNTGLSAYDACYAALAQRLELPLVSADQILCQKIPSAIWLGHLSLSGIDDV